MAAANAPRIDALAWGELRLAGGARFRDAKLHPDGAEAWDWRETGTRHDPGIQPADVASLLAHGPEVVVLATGHHGRLGVCPETLHLLKSRGVAVHVLRTQQAVRLYNRLRERARVAGLFHTTC